MSLRWFLHNIRRGLMRQMDALSGPADAATTTLPIDGWGGFCQLAHEELQAYPHAI